MSLRVNHNIAAINAHRHMQRVSADSGKNLEKLSSGLRINTAADRPASLVISEIMRAQIGGLSQAVENSENGVSMIQTAEGALSEVNKLLTSMRQLAIHASNVGANDDRMLEADQSEFANSIKSINRIATNTQFGTKQLLDGSRGANGVANGRGLQFVKASSITKSSPATGYKVRINQSATRSHVEGSTALTKEMITAGETLTVSEGGKTIQFTTKESDTIESTINELKRQISAAGLKVDVLDRNDNILALRHQEYGSKYSFNVSSSTAGVLSKIADENQMSELGKDVAGTIDGEGALGDGQILTGRIGNRRTEGLKVRYSGPEVSEALVNTEESSAGAEKVLSGKEVGTVSVLQNSLKFQIGSNAGQTVAVSLRDMKANALGTGITNLSEFSSIEDIDLLSFQGAQDAIRVIDRSIDEVTTSRAELGALQKNSLESNVNTLRVAVENMTASESTIRDADMAKEMATFTRNQILTQSATSILAQSNQNARNVLQLIG